jgi:hypothetical protein
MNSDQHRPGASCALDTDDDDVAWALRHGRTVEAWLTPCHRLATPPSSAADRQRSARHELDRVAAVLSSAMGSATRACARPLSIEVEFDQPAVPMRAPPPPPCRPPPPRRPPAPRPPSGAPNPFLSPEPAAGAFPPLAPAFPPSPLPPAPAFPPSPLPPPPDAEPTFGRSAPSDGPPLDEAAPAPFDAIEPSKKELPRFHSTSLTAVKPSRMPIGRRGRAGLPRSDASRGLPRFPSSRDESAPDVTDSTQPLVGDLAQLDHCPSQATTSKPLEARRVTRKRWHGQNAAPACCRDRQTPTGISSGRDRRSCAAHLAAQR